MPRSRAAGLGPDHQRFLQDHDERARARAAGQAARDAAIMDSYPRSDLRVLVRLFPGHDGQSDDRVLQQPRDRAARDLPAAFCSGYRGPKIARSMQAAEPGADWRSLLGLVSFRLYIRLGPFSNLPRRVTAVPFTLCQHTSV